MLADLFLEQTLVMKSRQEQVPVSQKLALRKPEVVYGEQTSPAKRSKLGLASGASGSHGERIHQNREP